MGYQERLAIVIMKKLIKRIESNEFSINMIHFKREKDCLKDIKNTGLLKTLSKWNYKEMNVMVQYKENKK